jgi:hypothetical protein
VTDLLRAGPEVGQVNNRVQAKLNLCFDRRRWITVPLARTEPLSQCGEYHEGHGNVIGLLTVQCGKHPLARRHLPGHCQHSA